MLSVRLKPETSLLKENRMDRALSKFAVTVMLSAAVLTGCKEKEEAKPTSGGGGTTTPP